MTRCRDCNSSLKPDEKECWSCGAAVVQKESARSIFGTRFASLITILFFASAVLTVASLFIDATPPFWKCLITTVVLLFVRSSAGQMLEKKGS